MLQTNGTELMATAAARGSLAFHNIHNEAWAPVGVEVEHVPERAISYGWAVHRDAILHKMNREASHVDKRADTGAMNAMLCM